MATQVKLTIKQGGKAKDVVAAAGTTISGGNAIELNMDITALTKGEARVLLKELDAYIHSHGFPQL